MTDKAQELTDKYKQMTGATVPVMSELIVNLVALCDEIDEEIRSLKDAQAGLEYRAEVLRSVMQRTEEIARRLGAKE